MAAKEQRSNKEKKKPKADKNKDKKNLPPHLQRQQTGVSVPGSGSR
ncbi:MAG TPA: hypothetical protein VNQ56_01560 [Pseudolabrys sp.]|nr:hypothetical protein [Pseudolabrys sp.]